MKDSLGAPVVVENRDGAGGRIAAEALKASAADGNSVLLAPIGTTIIRPATVSKLSSDPWMDFVHVSQGCTFRFAFAVGTGWFGVHAPAGTPKAIVDRYAAAIVQAMQLFDIKERLFKLGLEATGTTPEEFVRIMQADKARREPVIKSSGFRID